MKRLTTLFLPMLLLASLTGCKSGNGLSWKSGDKVYYDRILFDTSDEQAKNPHILLGENDSVASVKIGRDELNFGYKGKVLTLEAAALRKVGVGEKSAVVTFKKGKKKTVEIFNATKFIKTAQDFQDIGKDKTSCEGYYILANDIDCSSITNFEPIGTYYDEKDPRNFYFHGVLDGDGFAIKNVKCSYSDGGIGPGAGEYPYPSNYDVYSGSPKFTHPTHQQGDNVGIFQVIGTSGVVRNLAFDNCQVHGRTIVGVVAGNIMGRAENILINSNCSAKMDTHFYDDDCNVGGAFGIVAGSGNVSNVISLTSSVAVLPFYQDYDNTYVGKIGNGWDHPAEEGNTAAWWRFAGVSKPMPDSETKIIDSNGKQSNGTYSVVGKCWGKVENSVGASFKVTPTDEPQYDVAFGHTHEGKNKPTSGDKDLGSIENCAVYSLDSLKQSGTLSSYNFSADIWNIVDGSLPTLKQNVNRFDIAK